MSQEHRPCYAPTFGASSGFSCLVITITITIAIVGLIIVFLLTLGSESIRCLIRQLAFRMKYCGDGNTDTEIDLAFSLEDWLECHPEIRDAIQWQEPGETIAYPDWTDEQKKDLATAYRRIEIERDGGLAHPLPAGAVYNPGAAITAMEYQPALAWEIFVATVAQCLVVEVRGWVPWSLLDRPDDLRELLASTALFERYGGNYRAFGYAPWSYGLVTLGDSARLFSALEDEGILKDTPSETVEALIDWSRDHMLHYLGSVTPMNTLDHWQYLGFPPVESILGGTTRTSDDFFSHWTSGCWGTTGFFRAMLRSANLAVVRLAGCGHSLPSFLAAGTFLTHGDDPYNAWSRWEPTMPIEDILQPIAQYEPWFGEGADCTGGGNVGRGVVEAIKIHLPNPLLQRHCDDLAAGRDHAASEVFAVFSRFYTLAELEAEDLWGRIETAIADLGGCDAIP